MLLFTIKKHLWQFLYSPHLVFLAMQESEPSGLMTRRVARNIFSASYRFPPDIELSAECLNFVSKVLVSSPSDRMTAEEMLQHPWLSGKLLPHQSNVEESYQSILDIQTVMGKATSPILLVHKICGGHCTAPSSSCPEQTSYVMWYDTCWKPFLSHLENTAERTRQRLRQQL